MSEDTSDDPPSDVALAKGLPVLATVAGLGLAIVYLGVASVAGATRATQAAAISVAVAPLSVAMLYQAAFIWRNPEKGIEHDVQPPSKYDLGYESRVGARVAAIIGAVAGLFGLGMTGFFAYAAL